MTSENSLNRQNLDASIYARIVLARLFYVQTILWIFATPITAFGAEFHHVRLEGQSQDSHRALENIIALIRAVTDESDHIQMLDIKTLEEEAEQLIKTANALLSPNSALPFEDKHSQKALFDKAENFYILSIPTSEFYSLTYALIARNDLYELGLSPDVINEDGALLPFVTDDGFNVIWPVYEPNLSQLDDFTSEIHGLLWYGADGNLQLSQSEKIDGLLALSFSDKTAHLEFFSSYGASVLRFSFDDLMKTGFSPATGDLLINEISRKTDIHLGLIGQEKLDTAMLFKTIPQGDEAIFAGFVTSLPE